MGRTMAAALACYRRSGLLGLARVTSTDVVYESIFA